MAIREVPFLVAATVLHLAVPVAAKMAPPRLWARPLLAGHLRPTEVFVDVAIEPVPVSWPREFPPDAFPLRDPRRLAHAVVPRDHSPLDPPLDPTSNPLIEPPMYDAPSPEGYTEPPNPYDYGGPPVYDSPGGSWTWPGGGRSWALTPGGMPVGPSTDPAPTRTERRRPVDRDIAGKVISRAILHKDRTLGLDLPAAAAIASVVGSAVRGAETPTDCVARVAVTLGGDGRVQSVKVLSYSGGSGGVWRQVEQSAKAQLAARTFAMKSAFSKGAIVTVTARSSMRMPAGSGGRKGLTLTFDPSNIGARASRQVTTGVSVQALK